MRHHHSVGKRALASAALLAAGALLLAGCTSGAATTSSAGSDTPVRGGNITVRLAQDPGSLDAVASGNIGTTYISHEIFQQLVTINADYEPVPQLASSYTRSPDGLTYTFTLRHGIVFSDGTPLTAKDAAASLQYWVKDNSYAAPLAAVLDSITAPDDDTVVVKLHSPFNAVALMADSDGTAVIKASVAEAASARGFSKEQAIGSGPYKLKSWTPGQQIVLERNDRFVSPPGKPSGYAGARHAYLNTITYKVVSDQDAAVNGLISKQWDVTAGSDEQYDMLKHAKGVRVGLTSGVDINMLYLNHNPQSIFANATMRDAFNDAIDKKAILAARGNPDLNTGTSSFAATTDKSMYSTSGEDTFDEYNPAKAKKLFAEAGFKPGDTIKMITTGEFPQFNAALVLVQADLKKIGIASTIQSFDFGTMLAKMREPGAWDVCALMQDGYPPVPQYTDNVVGMSAEGYHPAGLDDLITAYNAAPNAAAARKAVDRIQAFTTKNKPTIVLNQSRAYVAYSDRIHGYDHWGWVFSNVWVDR